MSKRSIFTTVTPLPSYITRQTVIETLQRHSEMIELNPLVINYTRCKPPGYAPPDEFHCKWYLLTDKVHYLPGGLVSGNVSYKACFHDLPHGLQTHVYAPTGLDIKEKWSVGGNMPGEPRETMELGLPNVPREGLYLREDVDMRCNILATSFVKRTLKKAHGVLVDRLVGKADLLKEKQKQQQQQRVSYHRHHSSLTPSESYRAGIAQRHESTHSSSGMSSVVDKDPRYFSNQTPSSGFSTPSVTDQNNLPTQYAFNDPSQTSVYGGGGGGAQVSPHFPPAFYGQQVSQYHQGQGQAQGQAQKQPVEILSNELLVSHSNKPQSANAMGNSSPRPRIYELE